MKRTLWYLLVLAVTLPLSGRGMDVGRLQPVEVVYLDKQDDVICIETDTGDAGYGKTIEEAFDDLEETAKGVIYLDTASFLLVSETARELTKEISGKLKDDTGICICPEKPDLQEAAVFLNAHPPLSKLRDSGSETAKLMQENGRLRLK